MTTIVKLNGTHLVQPMVQDLRAEGVPPVVALERALEAHIFEKFRDGLGDRLVKPPVVRLHTMYFKDKYAALPALTSTGYETWYTEVCFSTRPGDEIKDLQIVADGINLIPIDYGSGVHRKVQTKISPLKRQTNHEFRINHLHVPGQLFYADDLDFRMTEVGGEAAVRFTRLLGFTLGANVAKGRSQLIEGYSAEDASGQLYQDATANGSKTTYGAFLGFDQTNPSGIAGFIRAGFQYRNMGSLPSQLVISDGTTTTQATGNTIPLDYGGFYLKLGIGYDLGH